MGRYNRILLKADDGNHEEAAVASGALNPAVESVAGGGTSINAGSALIFPGTLVKLDSAGTLSHHASYGGWHDKAIALENALSGGTVDQPYSYANAGYEYPYYWSQACQYYIPRPGDEVAVLLQTGQNVTIGDLLFSAGDGTVAKLLIDNGRTLLYSNTAASAEIEDTTTEALFNKSYSIPANFLRPGDVIRVKAAVYVLDNNSTDKLTLVLYIGGLAGTAIITTGEVDVDDGDVGYFDVAIMIRTIGDSGTFVATGSFVLGTPGTAAVSPFVKGSTAINTTVAQVIGIGADWSVQHADNEAYLDVLSVELSRTSPMIPLFEAMETLDLSSTAYARLIRAKAF